MSQTPPDLLYDKLRRASTREEIFGALENAYGSVDELHNEYVNANSIHLDCRKDCFWCCYFRVDGKAHEILAIAHHVEKKFSQSERAALIERLEKHAQRVKPLTYAQHMGTNIV